jgi:hypothetical protein
LARFTRLEYLILNHLRDTASRSCLAAVAALETFLDRGNLAGGLDGAQTAVHVAKQNAIDLGRAVERQERLLVGAAERLQQAYDLQQREKTASAHEKAAANVEAAAAELQRAIEAVAQAADKLAAAIPPNGVEVKGVPERVYWGWQGRSPDEQLNAIEIVRAVFAEGLYEKSPELFEIIARSTDILVHLPLLTRRGGKVARGLLRDDVDFLDAVGSAKAFVADPLRSLAEDIRAGDAPLDQPGSLALPPPPPPVPTTSMLLLKPVLWRNREGRVIRNDAWTVADIPVAVAKRAVELGAGVKAGSRDAEAHIQARQNQLLGVPYQQPDSVDLGHA